MKLFTNKILQDNITNYWERYKEQCALGTLHSVKEIYKWRVFNQVYSNWDWSQENKVDMILNTFKINGANNLWASGNYFPIRMVEEFLKEFPKETIKGFEILFNSSADIHQRINDFQQHFDDLLISLQNKYPDRVSMKSHYQDIRIISIYLMIQYPEDFVFYKYTVAKSFFEKFELKGIKKGDNSSLFQFNKIAEEIKNFILQDKEYIDKYVDYLANDISLFSDPELNILTQDFIYAIVEYLDEKIKKYWVYAPGENAKYWDEFYEKGIIAIGWDGLGDLENYSSKGEINTALQDIYEYETDPHQSTSVIYDFINDVQKGDIIIVKKGRYKLLGYGEVTSDYFIDDTREDFGNCREVKWIKKGIWDIDQSLPIKTITNITNQNTDKVKSNKFHDYLLAIIDGIINLNKLSMTKKYADLLQYKKQIILQGPPGTGKTKLAEELAQHLIDKNTISQNTYSIKKLTKEFIKSKLTVKLKLTGKKGKEYEIVALENNVVVIKSDTSKPWSPSYNKIIDSFNGKLWETKGRTGGFSPYEDIIAKYLYDTFLDEIEESNVQVYNDDKFWKIVQFHPSYTYEDFVRGIVSKPNEENNGVLYEAENKILADFSSQATNDPENYYVLIIDEINRANLSSVLGELIYALEYREKEVNSMYSVDGDNKLILPPNLFIIGTMNTADRSVGHIDYAIRRRFAFVDILPEDLSYDTSIKFDSNLFKIVSALFDKHISPEFEKKEVQLGHSYFIDKSNDGGSMDIRLEYEIKPILLEYVKDGVLIGKDIKKIIEDLEPSI